MKPYSAQAVATASGTAEADITPPPGHKWLVYQMAISSTSALFSSCQCFVNQRFMCGSNIGNADAADGSPLVVNFSDTLRFVWGNVTPGATCNVQLLVDEAVVGAQFETLASGATSSAVR